MLISERIILTLKVNMLITNNLQFIKGLSKMLIPESETFCDNILIRNNLQFIKRLNPTNCWLRPDCAPPRWQIPLLISVTDDQSQFARNLARLCNDAGWRRRLSERSPASVAPADPISVSSPMDCQSFASCATAVCTRRLWHDLILSRAGPDANRHF